MFVLLFLGRLGEIRVVLTKRSSRLRNFPGHISLPGGKADNGLELPWMVSRREMCEEIGILEDNEHLEKNYGFTIDHVTELPCYLLRTFSAVRPCVGFMNFKGGDSSELIHNLKLRVNPGESSSIFLCPLKDFAYPAVEEKSKEALDRTSYVINWGGIPWLLRLYTFLQKNMDEASWLEGFDDISASDFSEEDNEIDLEDKRAQTPPEIADENPVKKPKKDLTSWGKLGSRRDSDTNQKIYDVWGLTANILHDLAEMAYVGAEAKPREFGEEELIYSLWHHGNQMIAKERLEQESLLISWTPGDKVSFGDVLPRTEFNRLKRLYKM